MFTTGGRGFEVAYASYIWGAIILLALILWIWTERDIRKHGGKNPEKDDDEQEPRD